MSEKKTLPSGRENNFDAIRLLAALMVMAGHMGVLIGGAAPIYLGQSIQRVGVIIFFIVGGYLIAKSWMADPHPVRYAVKRVFRIIPPLAVFVVFAAFLAGPVLSSLSVREYFASPGLWPYFKNIALYIQYALPGVFEGNPYPHAVNGSLWSLPVEVFMYFLMPVILELARLRKNSKASHVALIVVGAAIAALSLSLAYFYPGYRVIIYATSIADALSLIPYFLFGSMFVLPEVRKLCNVQVASILLILFSCFQLQFPLNEIAFYLIFPYFIFSLSFDAPPVFARFLGKVEISYGIFLYGFFIQQVVVWWCTSRGFALGYNTYFILCTALTAVFAMLSYRYIEQPCLRLAKKILQCPKLQPRQN